MHDFSDVESLVRYVESIENDENAQLAILKEPLFLDSNHIELFEKQLEKFLFSIFNQPYEQSFRRGKAVWQMSAESHYKKGLRFMELESWIKRPFRNLERVIRTRIKKAIRVLIAKVSRFDKKWCSGRE